MMRAGGQLRVTGMGDVIGWDLPAVLALAEAMGVHRRTAALLVTAAECGVVAGIRKLNANEPTERED